MTIQRTWRRCMGSLAVVFLALGTLAEPLAAASPEASPTVPPASPAAASAADDAAIRQTAEDFTKAFNAGDAKALAALWTERGEYESDDGSILRGRAAIEAAFAGHFKAHPGAKSTVQIESIRFPSRDCAIEEGITSTSANGALPGSARYRVLHVRENGTWRIALCREWAAGESRMLDLDWLIGSWRGQAKEHELTISFSRDKDGPFLVGEFIANMAGKPVPLGTMKIGTDPASRNFVSWHFDSDGGYGHGVWLRERNHWVIDSRGTQGDGTPVASVNVLSRFGEDELGWRSFDRTVGGKSQPELPPLRLKRVAASK